MNTDRELMQQALEVLVDLMGWQTLAPADTQRTAHKAITALRERLAQPEQEPVAWRWRERINSDFDSWVISASEPPPYSIEQQPLYTTPPHRKPLTDEEMFKIAEIAWRHGWASCRDAEYIGEEAEDERWGMVGAEVVQDIAAHGIKGKA